MLKGQEKNRQARGNIPKILAKKEVFGLAVIIVESASLHAHGQLSTLLDL